MGPNTADEHCSFLNNQCTEQCFQHFQVLNPGLGLMLLEVQRQLLLEERGSLSGLMFSNRERGRLCDILNLNMGASRISP